MLATNLTLSVSCPQHVQGIAIDAARSNVDYHYIYICDAYKAFMQGHTAQVREFDPKHQPDLQ